MIAAWFPPSPSSHPRRLALIGLSVMAWITAVAMHARYLEVASFLMVDCSGMSSSFRHNLETRVDYGLPLDSIPSSGDTPFTCRLHWVQLIIDTLGALGFGNWIPNGSPHEETPCRSKVRYYVVQFLLGSLCRMHFLIFIYRPYIESVIVIDLFGCYALFVSQCCWYLLPVFAFDCSAWWNWEYASL